MCVRACVWGGWNNLRIGALIHTTGFNTDNPTYSLPFHPPPHTHTHTHTPQCSLSGILKAFFQLFSIQKSLRTPNLNDKNPSGTCKSCHSAHLFCMCTCVQLYFAILPSKYKKCGKDSIWSIESRTIIIFASTPTHNVLFINVHCSFVVCWFNILSFIIFWVIPIIPLRHYHYSCGVDFPALMELGWLLKLYSSNYH